MNFESATELGEAAGFGTKKKEAKDLRTIWQGLSTLKEKTKEKNYLTTPAREWDAAKFQAWLHSPSVNLGSKYAERFRKVLGADADYGGVIAGITDEALEQKFLMADADDRKTFFRQLEKLELARAASRGKGLLSGAFGGGGGDGDGDGEGASPPRGSGEGASPPRGSGGGGGGGDGGDGAGGSPDGDAAARPACDPRALGSCSSSWAACRWAG